MFCKIEKNNLPFLFVIRNERQRTTAEIINFFNNLLSEMEFLCVVGLALLQKQIDYLCSSFKSKRKQWRDEVK